MFDVQSTLNNVGVIAALALIGCLIFAECAVLVGLFVPGGDALLLVTGVFAAEGNLPLAGLLIVVFIASAAGYEVGYYIGKKSGPRVFNQRAGVFFRKEYAERATGFYAQHGGKTILVARFLGYVRTIVPLLAGIAEMRRSKFSFFNIIGALLWTLTLVMLGYWFGSGFTEQIKRYMVFVTVFGLVLVCSPTIYYLAKDKRARTELLGKFKFGRKRKN